MATNRTIAFVQYILDYTPSWACTVGIPVSALLPCYVYHSNDMFITVCTFRI